MVLFSITHIRHAEMRTTSSARAARGAARAIDEAADQRQIVDIVDTGLRQLLPNCHSTIVLREIQERADSPSSRSSTLSISPHWAPWAQE